MFENPPPEPPPAPREALKFAVIVVTAAPTGQGAEAGGAFVKIDGREALLKSVELFLSRDNVKQIAVVFDNDDLEQCKTTYGGHFGFTGVKVIGGGTRWMDQLIAAGEKLPADITHVLVHDAARPAVPYTDLERLMDESASHPVVALATPLRSTLVEVDEGGNALAYHTPATYMNLVTPQIFEKAKFLELGKTKVETHASEITLVKGSPLNVRVGGSGDVSMIKAMINMLPKPKVKAASPFEEAQW